jgi:M6 family metalloprotease-like protein
MPASPTVHQLKQRDSAKVAARQWGDEYLAGWETDGGYTLVLDAGIGSWTYAVQDRAGELVSSLYRADKDAPPTGVIKHIRPRRKIISEQFSTAGRQLSSSSSTLLPATPAKQSVGQGAATAVTRNLPVILINFSDTATTYSTADFTSLLFGSGIWSFRDYYEEVSGGMFSVSAGGSGVTDWVTAAHPHDYYGAKSGWGPPDAWPGDLAYEAVQQADAMVDFSVYDNDGDCIVDTVAIIHQGTAQEGSGIATDIWSHSWSLSTTNNYGLSHYGPYTTNDRCISDPSRYVVVDRYIMMPERYDEAIAGIGVFAHEYGHALGLSDLYDTDYTSEGIGNWSLMASGSWGGVDRLGDRPSHPDPWSKSILGWVSPVRIVSDVVGRTIGAVETGGEVSQFLGRLSEGGTGEYFLLENRQQTGFDQALPGSGLLLWHINESRVNNNGEWYPGCTNCSSHYKVALVQADGLYQLERKLNRGDGGDPLPGTTDNRAITRSTPLPASLYNGMSAGFGISSISDSGPVMSADFSMYDLTPPVTTLRSFPGVISSNAAAGFIFTANESSSFACRLDDGDFIPCVSPALYSGLVDGSHTFTVRATDTAGNMETAPPAYSWIIDTTAPICAVKVDEACFRNVTEAYAAIQPGSRRTIHLPLGDLPETVRLDRSVDVTLAGGYDGAFTQSTGTTVIVGTLTISTGSVVINRVMIRNNSLNQ